ncbi:cathepsin L-like peptidase [Salminus brasiliensis]|uniref:cathepsin L-like peptidase n=1 Tax=Salminus brasiliensis TaxID=930266 RepID=UPI003B834037
MRVMVTVATLVAVAAAASVSLEDLEFQEWKLKFGKIYSSEEEESQRKMIWLTNRKLVLEHNMLADQGLKSFRLDMTHFADMNDQEHKQMFKSSVRTFNRSRTHRGSSFLRQKEGVGLPSSVDWVAAGYVTPVKNQSHCSSSWAFSATGALEGQMFRKTRKLVPLSEQQLIDCSWLQGNEGCSDGSVEMAFQYVNSNGGLQTGDSYPYTGREGMCMFNPQYHSATCRGFQYLPNEDEGVLQKAVTAIGPISAVIDASKKTFLLYQSGIYNEPNCSSYDVNLSVLVIGYGSDSAGRDYWLVKNSWGVQWGVGGYIKMSRNKDNQCGIATRASFPFV